MSKKNPSTNSQRLAGDANQRCHDQMPRLHAGPISAPKKPRALVIVDFEGWAIELRKKYGSRPNLKGFVSDVKESFDIKDIVFYCDMSKDIFSQELSRLRCFSSSIFDTRNPNQEQEKDFTDFFILDRLYQIPFKDPDIDAVVLFSGDGHFAMAANFLKMHKDLRIEVYSVRNSLSKQLALVADKCVLVPSNYDILIEPCRLLLSNMRTAQRKIENCVFYFSSTISYAMRGDSTLDNEILEDALNR